MDGFGWLSLTMEKEVSSFHQLLILLFWNNLAGERLHFCIIADIIRK